MFITFPLSITLHLNELRYPSSSFSSVLQVFVLLCLFYYYYLFFSFFVN